MRILKDNYLQQSFVTERLKIPRYKGIGNNSSSGEIGDEP